ncbi:MAG: anaerobic ribonucleoside-triphosphate reductase activating protein [Actinomycetota bacterium]|nr:anaerobic ribonucleoside-triphosphate reductase activating protein [Actinomycetota bacterium]
MAVELKIKPRSVAGLIPVSMVDWEGKLAAIIFLSGCNLRCAYCHNPELITKNHVASISWGKIVDQLSEKKGWIDGVVITGGEPTINEDLEMMIVALRHLGLPVKLDTNGTRPEVVKELIGKDLIEFLAVDIKAAFAGYDAVTRVKGQTDKVKKTIEYVLSSDIDHEFRTTVVPGFIDAKDVLEIAAYLAARGAKRYFLQQFNPKIVLEPSVEKIKPFPPAYLAELAAQCDKYLPTKARGVS